MAMKSVQLFLAGEEDDFGFEFVVAEPEDVALTPWELVNPSDADLPDSDTDTGSASAINEVLPTLSAHAAAWVPAAAADVSAFPDQMDQCLDRVGDPVPSVDQFMLAFAGYYEKYRNLGCSGDADAGYDYEEGDDNDCDDDDDGLDDELVPRHLRGKLERQRMRKLGKRSCSKMSTSKRSPHLYVKPGCLYGKHGLGLKHSLC